MDISASALRPYLDNQRWLGTRNRYLKEPVKRLQDDLDSGGSLSAVNQKHLREYVAASAVTHCIDGWALLGRAVSSTLMGDPHSARHLAYYSELRATSSVLARSGLAVFNRQHLAIDKNGLVQPITASAFHDGRDAGTHKAAWTFLERWAVSRDAANLTASVITPEGVALDQWLNGTTPWARWRSNTSGWLRELGVDVRLMAQDQFARNEASYRPNTMRGDAGLGAPDSSQFVAQLWQLLEPSIRPFSSLDGFLLRSAIERAYRGATGHTADLTSTQYRTGVGTIVSQQGFDPPKEERVTKFLLRETSPNDPDLLTAATTRSVAADPSHHLHAMARAVLLLRVATGAAREMLTNAGIGAANTEFWWQTLASTRSICLATSPDDLLDVWADIAESIVEIQTYIADPTVSFVGLGHPDRCGALRALGKLELAGLVGLVA